MKTFYQCCKIFLGFSSAFLLTCKSANAIDFNLDINFDGSLSLSQQLIFNQAEVFWEGIITGYHSSITTVPDSALTINASGIEIDGVGGAFAQAGRASIFGDGDNPLGKAIGAIPAGQFVMASEGIMEFDIADLGNLENNNTLLDIIKHEMAHVIGFGNLWQLNGVYTGGTGQYTGANALAAYQDEVDPGATFVPVELGGDPVETAEIHWDELDGGLSGSFFTNELMSGWLNTPTFLSETTIQSFVDIGYTVVPELSSTTLLMASLVLTMFIVTRRRRSEK